MLAAPPPPPPPPPIIFVILKTQYIYIYIYNNSLEKNKAEFQMGFEPTTLCDLADAKTTELPKTVGL